MVVILTTLCLPEKMYAQTQFGLQVGINNSNISYEGADTEAVQGFSVGALVAFGIKNDFAIETSLKYSQKGYYNGYYVYEHLNYLDVPIQLKYNYSISNNLKLVASVGGYVAFGLNYKAIDDLNNTTYNYKWSESNFNQLDFGPIIGTGVRFKNFVISLDYQIGLSNMNKSYGKLKNRTVGLSLSYFF